MFGKFGSLDRSKRKSSKSSTPSITRLSDAERHKAPRMSTTTGGAVSVSSTKSLPSGTHQITAKDVFDRTANLIKDVRTLIDRLQTQIDAEARSARVETIKTALVHKYTEMSDKQWAMYPTLSVEEKNFYNIKYKELKEAKDTVLEAARAYCESHPKTPGEYGGSFLDDLPTNGDEDSCHSGGSRGSKTASERARIEASLKQQELERQLAAEFEQRKTEMELEFQRREKDFELALKRVEMEKEKELQKKEMELKLMREKEERRQKIQFGKDQAVLNDPALVGAVSLLGEEQSPVASVHNWLENPGNNFTGVQQCSVGVSVSNAQPLVSEMSQINLGGGGANYSVSQPARDNFARQTIYTHAVLGTQTLPTLSSGQRH